MPEEDDLKRRKAVKERGVPGARKAETVARRGRQLEEIAPVLESMPWKRIMVGRTRLPNIDAFLKYYEMYAPLLAEHKRALISARDSGLYQWFDLYATARMITVEGIDRRGNRKLVVIVGKNYWEETFSFAPANLMQW